jgi:RHS repeat-associated protein
MERRTVSWAAIAAVFLAGSTSLAVPRVALAVNPDKCIEAGRPAECTAPEAGQYKYQYTSASWTSGVFTESEEQAVSFLENLAKTTYNGCTSTRHNPAYQPTPPGLGSGTIQIPNPHVPGGDNFTLSITLGVESYQNKWQLRIDGIKATNATPPCASTYTTGDVQLIRTRGVACPSGYTPNGNTGPLNAYCYRNPATPLLVRKKNYGPCRDCDLLVGNPVNVATGNKYAEERDYIGSGAFPLQYVRRYNSDAGITSIFSSPDYVQRSRMWRGSYDRAVMFSDHASYPAADVYREDGRVVRFRLVAGQWKPDADVNDVLTRTVDALGNPTGWTLRTQGDELETFDVLGRLMSIQNRAGLQHVLGYDVRGRLISVTHTFGQQLTFSYDSAGFLRTVTVPGSQAYTYGYASTSYPNHQLTSVTYPDATIRRYRYENAGRPFALTGITDESNANFATYAYDSSGRVSSSEHSGGADRYTFAYPTSSTTTVTDALSTARTWTSAIVSGTARASAVSSLCPSCGSVAKSKSFDTAGNVTIRKDFNNNETRYAYEPPRNLETSRTEAYGTPRARPITTQWHSTFRLPTQIDEPGKRTTFTHDANGNVLTKTVLDTATSESRTWTYTYNSFGQVLTADGPRTDVSDVTTYTYYTCMTGYQCGQVQTITSALGHATTYNTYNGHGQPLTITDPNGLVTTLTYDARQRLTSRTVGTEQTTFDYWPTGLLKKATLPDGSFLEYTYDNAHRLTEIEDSEGNRTVYTLDNMGNRTAENVYDPSSVLTQTRARVFNTLNQLWKEIGAAGTAAVTTTFSYDNNGNETAIAAPLSRNTGQVYDELNRLTQVTDPLSGITQYGYNALDQLLSATDPRSKVTSYTYNALGDLTQQVSPDTGTTANTYDSGGNLATSTDARSKTGTYAYDAINRATSLTYSDQTIGYTYDGGTNQKGRLTQVSDASGSTSWAYDTDGRVLSRQQAMGVTKTLGYAYDSFGRLQTLTLPSGNTITYGYTDGKITSLTLNGSTTILSAVLYQPFGPSRGWTWGNSTLAIREYDPDGKVTDIDSAGLKTYGYDDAFRITGITDAANSSLTQSYGYDLLDRLTSATGTSLNQGWTYDANGNRLTQIGSAASTYTVSSTSNRLSTVSGALSRTYSYDNSGNATADGAATFSYNDAGRTVSATKAGVTTTYVLNALGQRVKKTTSGSSTYFVYDEAGQLVGEYDNSGNRIQETVWFEDTPVATLRPNGAGVSLFYIHTDHLNTPRRITRPSDNAVLWRWDSDPFGTTAANEDADGDSQMFAFSLRFPGQYLDTETGLHYNYFRDYDPNIGRYVQSDPIGLDGGINTYAYVAGNPVSLTDPDGLDYWVEDADPSESGLGLHQSICVGTHGTNNRFCISFGRKPGQGDCWFRCDGHTYVDRSPPGDIVYPMWRGTSRAVDRKIRAHLKRLLGQQRPWDAVGGENCRAFSQEVFDDLLNTYGGTSPPSLIDRLLR